MKVNPISLENLIHDYWLGKKRSEETKKKMSQSHKGKSTNKGMRWNHSEEAKRKMSLWQKERWSKVQRISNFKGKTHTLEAKLKTSENRKGKCVGENHHSYIKDRTKLAKRQKRNDSAYQNWVKEIKKRDNNKCQLENKSCSGYNIIHHIKSWSKYPELRYDINNGITLCQIHHPRIRVEEIKLESLFLSLI